MLTWIEWLLFRGFVRIYANAIVGTRLPFNPARGSRGNWISLAWWKTQEGNKRALTSSSSLKHSSSCYRVCLTRIEGMHGSLTPFGQPVMRKKVGLPLTFLTARCASYSRLKKWASILRSCACTRGYMRTTQKCVHRILYYSVVRALSHGCKMSITRMVNGFTELSRFWPHKMKPFFQIQNMARLACEVERMYMFAGWHINRVCSATRCQVNPC